MLRFWVLLVAWFFIALSADVSAQQISNDNRTKQSPAQSNAQPKPDAQPVLPTAIQDAIQRIPRALETANDKKPPPKRLPVPSAM